MITFISIPPARPLIILLYPEILKILIQKKCKKFQTLIPSKRKCKNSNQ